MSNLNFDFAENDFRPLAARMRPTNLEQYYGQTHLIGEGKPLRKAIQAGHVHSMILWGRRVQVKQHWRKLLLIVSMQKLNEFQR